MQPDLLYHNSAQAWITLRDTNVGHWVRPNGLWFSRGSTWIDYASNANALYARPYPHVFQIDIDQANVLVLSTEREYDKFTSRYAVGKTGIRWQDVAKDYDGVEISNPQLIRRSHWSSCWDVPSGCVWNASKLKIVSHFEDERFISQIQKTLASRGIVLNPDTDPKAKAMAMVAAAKGGKMPDPIIPSPETKLIQPLKRECGGCKRKRDVSSRGG